MLAKQRPFSAMYDRFLPTYYMPLDYLYAFVDQKLGTFGPGGSSAIPSARTTATCFFCGQ